MTVIAWDGKALAADKQSNRSSLTGVLTKIFRVNGMLVGYTGEAAAGNEMVEWIAQGCQRDKFPPTQRTDDWAQVICITADRHILIYEKTPLPIVAEDKFYAIGSGSELATMALHLGLSAAKAVTETCKLCHSCGGGIDVLDFEC